MGIDGVLGTTEGFKIKRGMSSGNKVFYRVIINTKNGKRHLIAKGLSNRRLAERLINRMEQVLVS